MKHIKNRQKTDAKKFSERMSPLFEYLFEKYMEIVEDGEYNLGQYYKKNKLIWCVRDKEHKQIINGSFKKCMDFIINNWIKKQNKTSK